MHYITCSFILLPCRSLSLRPKVSGATRTFRLFRGESISADLQANVIYLTPKSDGMTVHEDTLHLNYALRKDNMTIDTIRHHLVFLHNHMQLPLALENSFVKQIHLDSVLSS
jgi:hypothetical protein